MTKMTFYLKEFLSTDFTDALNTLLESDIKAKYSHQIYKLSNVVNEEIRTFSNIRMNTAKKYAILENDNVKLDDNKRLVFKSEDDKTKFVEEITDLINTTIEVDFTPIDFKEIENDVKLSTKKLMYLKKLFSNFE